LDLEESLIPLPLIEHLAEVMPQTPTGEGYDYNAFIDRLVNGATDGGMGMSITNGSSNHSSDKGGSASPSKRGSRHYL